MPAAVDLAAEKLALRRAALGRRDAMTPEQRAAGAAAVAIAGAGMVERWAGYRGMRLAELTVSAFWPMRSELDTQPLLAALARLGCTLALPVVVGKDRPLTFRRWLPGDALVIAHFGQSEPGREAPVVTPDVLFVPLAAADRAGNRIGYGGGFYDRTLAGLRATRTVFSAGLCFDEQVVDAIVPELHDERMDALLTPAGLLTVSA